MGGEGVSQQVWRDLALNASRDPCFSHNCADGAHRQPPSEAVEEECSRGLLARLLFPPYLDVCAQGSDGWTSQ